MKNILPFRYQPLVMLSVFISTLFAIGCRKSLDDSSQNDHDPKFENSGYYYVLANRIQRDNPQSNRTVTYGYYSEGQQPNFIEVKPENYEGNRYYSVRKIAVAQDSTIYINYMDPSGLGYFKIVNNVLQSQHVLLKNDPNSSEDFTYLGGLAVNNNNVYLSGRRHYQESKIDSSFIWKNNEVIANYFQDILLFTNGKLYTAGSDFYTIDGIKHQIDHRDLLDNNVEKMVIYNNDVYILGYLGSPYGRTKQYVYWKNGTLMDFSFTKLGVYDIAVKDGALYFAGQVSESSEKIVVGLWKNNSLITKDTLYNNSLYDTTRLYESAIKVKDMNISNDSIYTLYEEVQPDIAYASTPTIKFCKGDSLIFTNYTPSSNPDIPEAGSGFGNGYMSLIK